VEGAVVGERSGRRERLAERPALPERAALERAVVGRDGVTGTVVVGPGDRRPDGDRERGWKLKLAIDTALPVAAGGSTEGAADTTAGGALVGAAVALFEQAASASMAGKTKARSRA
jgi:hypothetical protein